MSNYLVSDTDLTSVANAIRTKGGTSAQLEFPTDFVSAIGAIPSGGGGISVDDIATNTEPSGDIVLSNSVTSVASRAFQEKTHITSISGNGVTIIRQYAFGNCTGLTEVSFPNCIYLSNTSAIQDGYLFAGCTNLQGFNLKKVQYAYGYYVFGHLGSSSKKAIIALPDLVMLDSNGAFRQSYFSAVDLGEGLANISNNAFYQGTCDNLILRRKNSVVSAGNKDALARLTTALGNTIYIPKVLYDHLGDGTAYDYQAATNWSSATRTYAQIEGSYYETHYADGTLIPT